MGDKIRIAALEVNGVELDYSTEYDLNAANVEFNNTVNGFAADDVQGALGEARDSSIGSVVPLQFWTSGNAFNKWLGYSGNPETSDLVPFIAPQDMDIKGVIFSNRDDDVDMDIEVYINGTLAYTEVVRNKRYQYSVGIAGPTVLQGDRVSVFLREVIGGSGDKSAQGPLVILYCKLTNEAAASGGAQNGI